MERKTIAQKTVAALKAANKTLSCAESCTGGLIAKSVTDVSGASAVFHGGVVSYVNAVKNVVLGVNAADLREHGPVSEPVARQMAEGAKMLLHTDLAVSTTGVAGPDKDEKGNDVGTVYVALAAEHATFCWLCHFDGDRAKIRRDATAFALKQVLRYLDGKDMTGGHAVIAFTEADYAALLARLRESGDEKYRVFNESLMPGTENTYGVRAPALRALAKELLRGDWRGFLAHVRPDSHEERLLWGMVAAGAKCSLEEKFDLFRAFIPHIDNWAVCDMTAGDCKWTREHLGEVWDFFAPYLRSENEFEVRFAAVQLMDYFWDDAWIDRSLAAYRTVKHEGYYVTMALAWGLSVFFVKQREKTLPLLEGRVFSPAVHNKAIQKCRESLRVSREDKEYLNTLKIKG